MTQLHDRRLKTGTFPHSVHANSACILIWCIHGVIQVIYFVEFLLLYILYLDARTIWSNLFCIYNYFGTAALMAPAQLFTGLALIHAAEFGKFADELPKLLHTVGLEKVIQRHHMLVEDARSTTRRWELLFLPASVLQLGVTLSNTIGMYQSRNDGIPPSFLWPMLFANIALIIFSALLPLLAAMMVSLSMKKVREASVLLRVYPNRLSSKLSASTTLVASTVPSSFVSTSLSRSDLESLSAYLMATTQDCVILGVPVTPQLLAQVASLIITAMGYFLQTN